MKLKLREFLDRYHDRFVSKWLVLCMDMVIVVLAFFVATAVRFNFDLVYMNPGLFKYHMVLVGGVKLLFFLVFSTHSGIIRHTGLQDFVQILNASLASLLLLFALSLLNLSPLLTVPVSILLLDFLLTLIGLFVSRILIKQLFESLSYILRDHHKVIIYGAGRHGIATWHALKSDPRKNYRLLFFMDDNARKTGKSVEGIRVYDPAEGLALARKFSKGSLEVIFAAPSVTTAGRSAVVDRFLAAGARIRIVPPVNQWIDGKLSARQITEVKIEDLLERPSIRIKNAQVQEIISGKRIMITGAAGSIGSEIVRQVMALAPEEVVLVDQAESALYDLESELLRLKTTFSGRLCLYVENVTQNKRMERLFKRHRPQLLFHAAAYKHVPLMEASPAKAVEVNVLGTRRLADLAVQYEVEKFVFISTDKAVNPTNVMGASKRVAEMYVQSLNAAGPTRFITTRFGNVLGSNGSVIPLFKRQIENGGPVTVTHPDIIRYFMTIPEACSLVLEAGTMGTGGEIFVFDMGVPVRIADLAEKMIRLSGLEPHSQIRIAYSGLRPGEKLFEELLNNGEAVMKTHHPKIMIAHMQTVETEKLKQTLYQMEHDFDALSRAEFVGLLRQVVPEYTPKNSPYEAAP